MSKKQPFEILELTTSELDLYKLLIQLSRKNDTNNSIKFDKIKIADIIKLSKYSKPIIYEVFKKLEDMDLVQIDNSRPMFIEAINPEIAIRNLISNKKNELNVIENSLLKELNELPDYQDYIPSKSPPISFFDGVNKYLKRLKLLLERAKYKIILICGFLIEREEYLLREYIGEKLESGLEVNIFYGGSVYDFQEKEGKRFKDFFKDFIIQPNKHYITNAGNKCTIDGAVVGPPLRITLVDDSDLIMALSDQMLDKNKQRSGISRISSFQSVNPNLLRFTEQTYKLITTFFIDVLGENMIRKQIKRKKE